MDTMQKTLVLLKPDAIQRGVCGEILHRLERAGLNIVGMKMVWITKEFGEKHYFDVKERHGEKVLDILTESLSEGPLIAMVIEGIEAIATVRKLAGTTYPFEAAPGTIRGDFAHISKTHAREKDKAVCNLIHASASEKDAEYELKLWFEPKELHSYTKLDDKYTF
ncbi:MAG: nucleoside-diphosphate kinase [Candidatus Diapherotrites archaeon CG08_land_8_20_14_0_20_30_16]|nr:MAG: nucleoside-diphosphate kinase [Candidatus Diapherotrites archaeon CG08_land_8_20_14_0_20_30_16]